MWLLMELIIVLGLVAMISVELFDGTHREAIEREGRQIAAVVEELQAGVDAYVAQTGEIATCLDLRGVVADWIDGNDARTGSGPSMPLRVTFGGNAPGREASMWHPVALFPASTTSPPTPSTSNYDGARKVCEKAAYLPAGPWYLPSLAEAGLLPPALDGLEYSSTASEEYWGRYNLRFRLWARYVNATPARAVPKAGYQPVIETLLVVGGDPLPEAIAQAARRAIDSGAVGLISSRSFSDSPKDRLRANLDVMGSHGGWSREICADAGTAPSSGYLSKGGVPLCTALMGYINTVSTGADILRRADLLPLSTESDFGFRRASVAGRGYISGAGPADPPQAVIAVVSRGAATDALARALHRTPTGDPALHRMHTELNMGGFGVLNAPFLSGIDDDGDGYPDYGVHTLGPNPSDKAVTSPNVVHGDLVVTGNLQVGCDDLSFAEDTSLTTTSGGTSKRTTGNVHACGSMLLGADGTFYGDELRPERTGSTDIASGNLLVAGNTQHGLTTASRPPGRPDPGLDPELVELSKEGYSGSSLVRRALHVQEAMSALKRLGPPPATRYPQAFLSVDQILLGPPDQDLDPTLTAKIVDSGLTDDAGDSLGGLQSYDRPTSALRLAVRRGTGTAGADQHDSVHVQTADETFLRLDAPDCDAADCTTSTAVPLGIQLAYVDANRTRLQTTSRPSGYETLDDSLPGLVTRAVEHTEVDYPAGGYSSATQPTPSSNTHVYSSMHRGPTPSSVSEIAARSKCPDGTTPFVVTSPLEHRRRFSAHELDDGSLVFNHVTADKLPSALGGYGGATLTTDSIPGHGPNVGESAHTHLVEETGADIDPALTREVRLRAYQQPWTGWAYSRDDKGLLHDTGEPPRTWYSWRDADGKYHYRSAHGEARQRVAARSIVLCHKLSMSSYASP